MKDCCTVTAEKLLNGERYKTYMMTVEKLLDDDSRKDCYTVRVVTR
jgi:hypothetical protein